MGLFDAAQTNNPYANQTQGGVRGVVQQSNVGNLLSGGQLNGSTITVPGAAPKPTTQATYPDVYTAQIAPTASSPASFSQYLNGRLYTDPNSYQQAVLQDAQSKHDQTVSDANTAYLQGKTTFQDRQSAINDSLKSLQALYNPQDGSGTIQSDYAANKTNLGNTLASTLGQQAGYFSGIAPGATQSNQAVLQGQSQDQYGQGLQSLDQQKASAVQGAQSAYDSAGAQQNALQQFGTGLGQQYVNAVGSQYAGQQAQQSPDQYGFAQNYLNTLGGTPVTGSADQGVDTAGDAVKNFVTNYQNTASGDAASRTYNYSPLDIAGFVNTIVGQGATLGYAPNSPEVQAALNQKLGQSQGGAGLSPKDIQTALDQYQNKSGTSFK